MKKIISSHTSQVNKSIFPAAYTITVHTYAYCRYWHASLKEPLKMPRRAFSEVPASEFNNVRDVPFYAATIQKSGVLITGNLKHFPLDGPVEVLTPRLALDKLETLS